MRNPTASKKPLGFIVAIAVIASIGLGAIFIMGQTPKATSYSEYLIANSYSADITLYESLPKVCSSFTIETGVEIDDEDGRVFTLYDWTGTQDQYDACTEEILSSGTGEIERIDWTIPYDSTYGRIPTFDDLGVSAECSKLYTKIEPDWEPPSWTRLFPFLATKEAHFRFDGTEEERKLCRLFGTETFTAPSGKDGLKIRPPK